MFKEEGPWSLYFGINFYPNLLSTLIFPAFEHGTSLFIERILQISPVESPVTFLLYSLGISSLELLIRCPLITIKRRLAAQVPWNSSNSIGFHSMIEQSIVPYSGPWDCFKRIILEEGGQVSLKNSVKIQKRKKEWLQERKNREMNRKAKSWALKASQNRRKGILDDDEKLDLECYLYEEMDGKEEEMEEEDYYRIGRRKQQYQESLEFLKELKLPRYTEFKENHVRKPKIKVPSTIPTYYPWWWRWSCGWIKGFGREWGFGGLYRGLGLLWTTRIAIIGLKTLELLDFDELN